MSRARGRGPLRVRARLLGDRVRLVDHLTPKIGLRVAEALLVLDGLGAVALALGAAWSSGGASLVLVPVGAVILYAGVTVWRDE